MSKEDTFKESILPLFQKDLTKEEIAAVLTQALAFLIVKHSMNEEQLEIGLDIVQSTLDTLVREYYSDKIKNN